MTIAQKETDKQIKETDRQLRKKLTEVGRQIGGLNRAFGSFTEGMAFPALEKILQEHFGMTSIITNFKVKRYGESLEMDVFAYNNGKSNVAYIVEIKSHLREDDLQQMFDILRRFPEFFVEHADKQLYGILAAVNIPNSMRTRVLKSGIYLANIHDDSFKLQLPDNFKAKNFQVNH